MDRKTREFAYLLLRRGSYRWSAREQARKRKIIGKRGRAYLYECEYCLKEATRAESNLDHKHSVIPLTSGPDTYDFNEVIDRLYCKTEGFTVLCLECHEEKTQYENSLRRSFKNNDLSKEEVNEKIEEYLKSKAR